ncbi:hypothetical protein FB45DRAFT_1069376 [Roridomyces roridus]|uniref:F-box domain-containing protein n=1 Tax=Roridomyces roridus TaxID=1738132 RepID=A0AAD7F6N6_9AGAR|nr:hypothetical protein FB45DRAFT_1069376 [Roridomyces roridus]
MPCDSSCSTHCGLFGPLDLGDPSDGLVSSNDAPSSLQIDTISAAIGKAETHLVRVKEAIAILTAQGNELEVFLQNHRAVMSPLRRLPNEMLSEIFLRCMDFDAPFDPVRNEAWVLARVCRRWRSVASTTSHLWSHFIFPQDEYTGRPRARLIPRRLWETQLERAYPSPLTIRFPHHAGPELLDIFFSAAHRWKDVVFVNVRDFTRFVNLGVDFPYLQRLAMNDDTPWEPLLPTNAPGADLMEAMPALTHLTLSLRSHRFPRKLQLPWWQLCKYDVGNFQIPHIREILPFLSPGSHLTLRVGNAIVSERDDVAPILTGIESLEIMGGLQGYRSHPLNILVAPLLKKLLITGIKGEKTHPAAITTFLNNSRCALQHLRISGCTPQKLMGILELPAARNIVHLEIGHIPMEHWGHLFGDFQQRGLVPNLQTLVVRGDLRRSGIAQLLANRNPVLRVYKGRLGPLEWTFPEKPSSAEVAGGLDVVVLHEPDIANTRLRAD